MSKKNPTFYNEQIPSADLRRLLKRVKDAVREVTQTDPDQIYFLADYEPGNSSLIHSRVYFSYDDKIMPWSQYQKQIDFKVNQVLIDSGLSEMADDINWVVGIQDKSLGYVGLSLSLYDINQIQLNPYTKKNPKKPKKKKGIDLGPLGPLDEALEAVLGITEDEFDKLLDEIENRKKYRPTGKEVLINYAKSGNSYTAIGKITAEEFRKLLWAGVPWERDYSVEKKGENALIYEFEDGRKFFFLTEPLDAKGIDSVDLMHWLERQPKNQKNPLRRNPSHFQDDKYRIDTWFERNRAHVILINDTNGEMVVEWWDNHVAEAIEDGFLDPKNFLKSALEYAWNRRLIWRENRPVKKRNPNTVLAAKISETLKKVRALLKQYFSATEMGDWVDVDSDGKRAWVDVRFPISKKLPRDQVSQALELVGQEIAKITDGHRPYINVRDDYQEAHYAFYVYETKPNPRKPGREAQKRISKKIAKLRREGYSAKQAAAIAYKYERAHMLGPRGGKKNPIEDKDLAECIEALAILSYLPHYTESFDEHILNVLEAEGLWSYDSGVTEKGKEFLGNVSLDHTDI